MADLEGVFEGERIQTGSIIKELSVRDESVRSLDVGQAKTDKRE